MIRTHPIASVFIGLLLLGGLATSACSQVLTHRYSFNEPAGSRTFADSVGSADGTVIGTASLDGSGHLVLPGGGGGNSTNDNYAELPSHLIDSYSAVTFEFWVAIGSSPTWGRLVDFGNTDINGYWENAIDCAPNSGWNGINFEVPGWHVTPDPPLTNWTGYLVLIFNPGQYLAIYTNGFLMGMTTGVLTPMADLNTVHSYLGRSSEMVDPNGVATIDEFRIYNGILSLRQIAADAAAGPAGMGWDQPYAATATATLVNDFVVGATVTDGGLGYTNTPTVSIIGGGGSGAQAVAVVSNGVVIAVNILDAGDGYTNAPVIVIAPPFLPQPVAATATATVVNDFVVGATVTDGGLGYTNTPTVTIIGGGGSGAEAVAVVSNGVVVAVNILDAGDGYTNPPVLVIAPPFLPQPTLGIAAMSLLSFTNLAVGTNYQLQSFLAGIWSNLGAAFTAAGSTVTQYVSGTASANSYRLAATPVPSQAYATAQLDDGFVVGATVTNGGSGYATIPAVSIIGGGGGGAQAVAVVSNGVVTVVNVLDAGYGYTNAPSIIIAPPPATATALSPMVTQAMELDLGSLWPYGNYQLEFSPVAGGVWSNLGLPFTPTSSTSTQYVNVSGNAGFFRLAYVP
jgi:hypothetical protein